MQWPLVGREPELALMGELLGDASAGGVVVAGAPGVGKTRLVAEVAAVADGRGFVVEWARATRSAASMPLGAFAALLPVEPAGGSELLARVRVGLAGRAGDRRLLLCVDDAHLLDDASAALVHQLVAAREAFALVAVRQGEPAPDALRALWKDEHCELIELADLGQGAAGRLLEGALGAAVDGRTLDDAWQLTLGNPMFLRELVRYGRDRGVLVDDGGIWRWRGDMHALAHETGGTRPSGVLRSDGAQGGRGEPAPGSRLAELVGARLEGLDPAVVATLEVVAVGAPLEVDLLDEGEAGAVEALDGIVEIRADDRRRLVDLTHPLYGDAVRARMSRLRVEAIQRRLADALEARGLDGPGDVLRIAAWRLDSGGAGDPDLFEQAAGHALAALDFALAERLARAAIAAGGGFDARLALGRALAGAGRAEEADELLASLEPEDDERRAAVAIAAARNLFWGLDRAADALALLGRAEHATGAGARGELAAQRVRLLAAGGRAAEALAAASDVVGDASIREPARANAAVGAAEAMMATGRLDDAIALADEWLPAARRQRVEQPQLEVVLESEKGVALRLAGRLAEATSVSEGVYRAGLRARSALATSVEATMLGLDRLACGRVRTALRLFRESAATMRDADATGMLPFALAGLAQAAAQAGEPGVARAAVEEMAGVPIGHKGFEFELDLGRAWSAAASGELSRAIDHARAAALLAETRGQAMYELRALHELCRLGGATAAVAERIAGLAAEVDGEYAQTVAAHATALAHPASSGPSVHAGGATRGVDASSAGDLSPRSGASPAAALLVIAERFAGQGFMLVAAEAGHGAAERFRAEGREASARSAAARGAGWLGECEGARPPTLIDAPAAEELTPREREIALLAAGGASSREIAAGLVLSVRTVDNHLQRVYRKLGVSRREELVEVLGRAG